MLFFLNICAIIKGMNSEEQFKKAIARRNFYTSNDAGKVFLYVFLLPILFSFIFSYIGYGIASAVGVDFSGAESWIDVLYQNHLWFTIPYALISQITFVCTFFIYNKVNRVSFSASKLKVKKINPWLTVICAVFGILFVICLFGLIEGCFGELFSLMGFEPSVTPIPLNSFGWYMLWILIFAIVPAFCEELIFRGVVFNGLKKSLGSLPAIFLSALTFALVHQNIQQFIYPFIMGIVFAVIADKTGNIFYTMIMHLFNNITTITIQYMLNTGALNLDMPINAVYIIVSILLALVIGSFFFLFYWFYLKKHKAEEEEEVGEYNSNPIILAKIPLSLWAGWVISLLVLVINAVLV